QLIVIGLHAEQHPALAAGHAAAEFVDVVGAGFLDSLNRVRDPFTNLGLRRDAGRRPHHCQQGSGEDGSPRGGDPGWSPISRPISYLESVLIGIVEEAAPVRGPSYPLNGAPGRLRTGFRATQKASQLGKESNANWPQGLPASEQGRCARPDGPRFVRTQRSSKN